MVYDPADAQGDVGEELEPEVPVDALAARDAVQVGHEPAHEDNEEVREVQQPAPEDEEEQMVPPEHEDDKAVEDQQSEGQKAAKNPREMTPPRRLKVPQA